MILGIIPARGDSCFKNKNVKPLCGIPMIAYTIEAAKKSRLADWFVFTDKYTDYKTLGIKRLTQYSQGEYNSVVGWLPYAISEYEKTHGVVDAVCLLQPTSPLRTSNDIDKALSIYLTSRRHSLTTGYYMRIKTDEKADNKCLEKHYQRNGAIFIFDKYMIEKGVLFDSNSAKMEMPKSRSIDVDDEEDFFIAEALIKAGVLECGL